jgi:SNF2 family DNA or RNA helicase
LNECTTLTIPHMPTIYDNIENKLFEELQKELAQPSTQRADFCVGYFNLRGWGLLADHITSWSGEPTNRVRLLIGMNRPAGEELERALFGLNEPIDNGLAKRLLKKIAVDFRKQLTFGVPSQQAEKALRSLAEQLRKKQVVVKLYLREALHAKLYLIYQSGKMATLGYVGSSNLTMAGLSNQGELNVDVVEQDAAEKLSAWFEDRWNDRWSFDVSEALISAIDESWASDRLIPPHHIYLKMAWHLSQEARAGMNEFSLPKVFEKELLDFQEKAVLVAARHLHKRGGVLIGDVVGLGKTITASALVKLFEEDFGYETLIICPPNLIEMWERNYVDRFHLRAKVISSGSVVDTLADFKNRFINFRVVVIDESHNLRNPQGQRYQAIKQYLDDVNSKVILLSATPYNKSFTDLSSQLQLFIEEDIDLGIIPDEYVRSIGGAIDFSQKHTDTFIRSIKAFEKSEYAEDWRNLMRMYMVRRTRSFIKNNYAGYDPTVQRYFLQFSNGTKAYFPDRQPKKVEFSFQDNDSTDQYAALYSDAVVESINNLELPRYGLKIYLDEKPKVSATPKERAIIDNLSRAGKRLMGFCRTNLFKRLESSGYAFLLSLSRHALRNAVFIYALENNLPLPIGKEIAGLLDEFIEDSDIDGVDVISFKHNYGDYMKDAKSVYESYASPGHKNKFDWIRGNLFKASLKRNLINDLLEIADIIKSVPEWQPANDRKLIALYNLCSKTHGKDKILVFTQFSDTAEYLQANMKRMGLTQLECVTGNSVNPTALAHRFSPVSNKHIGGVNKENEIRVLVSTDVLSEGQNLQDAHIIVNYDLPWAIIRLIQRAGRVDRIGQLSQDILCYSFLPENGIERIIRLRARLTERISQNSEVVGSDETFFDGDPINISDLYSEKTGIYNDDESEKDIDLASHCFQIWKNAVDENPDLAKVIPALPNVVYSTKPTNTDAPDRGVVVFTRTSDDNDVLMFLNENGVVQSMSQFDILNVARATASTMAIAPLSNHHQLVERSIVILRGTDVDKMNTIGTLGRPTGVKYKLFTRLSTYLNKRTASLFVSSDELELAISDIYRYPLRTTAKERIARQMKAGISDDQLAEFIVTLREQDELSIRPEDGDLKGHHIICSLGISNITEGTL